MIGCKLPQDFVKRAADPLSSYIWNFLYLVSLHDNIVIMLKRAVQYVPIIGPGLKLFGHCGLQLLCPVQSLLVLT